jgi:hypothetical protein
MKKPGNHKKAYGGVLAASVILVIALCASYWMTCRNHDFLKENGLPDWDLLTEYAHSDTVDYSEMRSLFMEEKVSSFAVNGNTLFMELREPLNGSNSAICKLPSFSLFYEDMQDLIEVQWEAGIITEYDYQNVAEDEEIKDPARI